jgi:hypothetical protein
MRLFRGACGSACPRGHPEVGEPARFALPGSARPARRVGGGEHTVGAGRARAGARGDMHGSVDARAQRRPGRCSDQLRLNRCRAGCRGCAGRGVVGVMRWRMVEHMRGDRSSRDHRDGQDSGGDLGADATARQQRGGAFAYPALPERQAIRREAMLKRPRSHAEPRQPTEMADEHRWQQRGGLVAEAAPQPVGARRGSARSCQGARRRARPVPRWSPRRFAAPGLSAPCSRTAGRCRRAVGSARACVRMNGRCYAPG